MRYLKILFSICFLFLPCLAAAQIKDNGTTTEEAVVEPYLEATIVEEVVPRKEFFGFQENLSLRTEQTEVYEKPNGDRIYKIYAAPTYAISPNGLYQYKIEYEKIYAVPEIIIKNDWPKLINPALAQTFYSGAGDGSVSVNNDSWTGAREALTGTADYEGGDYTFNAQIMHDQGSPPHHIARAFLPFNTESITDSDVIDSATVYVMALLERTTSNIAIIYNTTNSATALQADDYVDCGDRDNPDEIAARQTNWTAESYSSFALTDLTGISTTGYTKLCLREGTYDIDAGEPASSAMHGVLFYPSETAGTAKDPYIVIETSPAETSTTTATTSCEVGAGPIDDDAISAFMLYWFYVVIAFIILTLGYWLVDRFFHSLSGRKYKR